MTEIVIKIDDKLYNRIKYLEPKANTMLDELMRSVQRGTPLPKGHQDLIDRIEVIKSLFDYHNGKKTLGQCVDDVQAIVEADKGE